MILGIVQIFWNAFSDLVSSILSIDLIFYIGVGFLLLMALFSFIRARSSYEYKLNRTADRLNDWLDKHQTITDQNLVEFNNIIKDRKTPKILRKYWQQYMLYRDKAPSEYISTYNCIDKPLKTSSFTSSIKNFTIIYKMTAFTTFFLSMFCYVSRTDMFFTYLTQSLIASIIILFLGVVLTIGFRAMQNYNIATLYQAFNIFARYLDKASVTIPKYVDFEILFTKKEINDGIPILGEYLEKRARQEQEELEEAQRNAVSHEEYNFAESGIDGSLVLERAMKESETYINIKQRLLTEIQQFESEISTLKKNYENTSKDYQRKLQASKENMERLRQQQEESTNRIEVNYIRKQQQDEVKKQEQLEKDQEDATNKFNAEVNSLSAEIDKRRTELDNKKLVVQQAMLNEYQTFSSKLHKSIADTVEKDKNEAIQQINNEKTQYAQAITYLKNEVESRDELIKSKDQTISELATKLQEYLGGKYTEQKEDVQTIAQENQSSAQQTSDINKNQQTDQQVENIEENNADDEPQGHYDNKGYFWFNNGTYYDDQNLYHDLEGNVYDADGNLLKTGQIVEQEFQLKEPVAQEVDSSLQESQPEEFLQDVSLEKNNVLEQQEEVAQEQLQKNKENIEEQSEVQNIQENPTDGKVDASGNFVYPNGSYYDNNNLYHNIDGKIYNTEGIEIKNNLYSQEEKPKRKAGQLKKEQSNETEQPKRNVGRPRKNVEEQEKTPKRKAGRPKKVEQEPTEKTPKRKAGRPKKIEEAEKQPKRKVGRPKKEVTEQTDTPKRKAGRPKKEKSETAEQPKRKVGRPKKADTADQSAKLLQQLGQSLLNITSNSNND